MGRGEAFDGGCMGVGDEHVRRVEELVKVGVSEEGRVGQLGSRLWGGGGGGGGRES